MQILANFAAMGIRQQRQQVKLLEQARACAAMAMAHELAHQIDNPLQSLTNNLFVAKHSGNGEKALALKLEADFERLSVLVKGFLELPRRAAEG